MTAVVLLERLQGVRAIRPGQWVAKCPAHDDGRPSLSIKETADGKVLMHCFAGCAATDVIAAVGLEFSELFPEIPQQHPEFAYRGTRTPAFDATAALHALSHECAVVALLAEEMAVASPEADRLYTAASRIHRALAAIGESRYTGNGG